MNNGVKSKNKHSRWIDFVLKKTSESPATGSLHCALLIKSGRVMSVGFNNHTKRGMLAHKCYDPYCGWHAELSVLYKIHKEEARGCILYVGGKNQKGEVLLSKPCKHCQEFLREYDLKGVYYSVPNGEYEEMTI